MNDPRDSQDIPHEENLNPDVPILPRENSKYFISDHEFTVTDLRRQEIVNSALVSTKSVQDVSSWLKNRLELGYFMWFSFKNEFFIKKVKIFHLID